MAVTANRQPAMYSRWRGVAVVAGSYRHTSKHLAMNPAKRPTIRPGQRVPYHKGTQAEIDHRRGFVTRMLDAGTTKTEKPVVNASPGQRRRGQHFTGEVWQRGFHSPAPRSMRLNAAKKFP